MIEYIDQEEKELIESLHTEDWVSNPDASLNKIYQEYARNSIELTNKIEISLSERDIQKIKVKAIQEGIPYQSIISLLIHKYNEGKIAIKI